MSIQNRNLFKAQTVDTRKWVEGNLILLNPFRTALIVPKDTDFLSNNDGTGIFRFYTVFEDTVCQYTGFHDATLWEELTEQEKVKFLYEWNYEKGRKNIVSDWKGKKIFEYDCLGIKENVVELCSGDWCINGDIPLSYFAKSQKIVGNAKED